MFKKLCLFFFFLPLSAEVFEGYTLFTPGGGPGGGAATTYLIDNESNNFHTWSHSNGAASMPYLLAGDGAGWENTLLIYPYRVSNPTMNSGGVGGGVQCLTWNGDLVWSHQISNSNYQHHHDVEPLPNGNVIMIAWDKKTATEAYAAGRQTLNSGALNEMWGTALFEMQPNGNGGADVVWEWYIWDHLIQDIDPSDDNYGIVSDHPELFDINNGNAGTSNGPNGPNGDWMHINAVTYNPIYDQIAISSRFQDEIFVIDHSTTTEEAAGHSGGTYGKGGDFLYRWGKPGNYDRGDNSYNDIGDQHGINWIPEGYPGEGNFILFNNSGNEALEFVPPVDGEGNYFIEDGQPYGPQEPIWTSPSVSTQMQGGAFRLPNGNTLVTDCDDGTIKEYSPSGSTEWQYTNSQNIARAQKFSIDYFDNITNIIPGDVNDDGFINVLDVVIAVNIILGFSDMVDAADYNGDGTINVLDVVSMVNVILGN